MPAPTVASRSGSTGPVLGHVNLMVDTFIANANAEDLRAIVRGTLATSPLSTASALTAIARRRLLQTKATALPITEGLFPTQSVSELWAPTSKLRETLSRIRALYGAGLGFASLRLLAAVVQATMGVRWKEGSNLESILASIDADISQAIQSSREELESGRVTNVEAARAAVTELRSAVRDSREVVDRGAGGYPFEQGAISLDFWKI